MIYAVLEGETTERDYLAYLEDRFGGNPRTFEIHPIWERDGLKPNVVVTRAVEKVAELDNPDREQVWAFFDRDTHEQVAESYARAEAAGVHVAFSNPCFELWLLLHFVPGASGALSPKGVQDQLRSAHPSFSAFVKSLGTAQTNALHGAEKDAVQRAKMLITNCPSVGCSAKTGHRADCRVLDRLPSTEVWKLLVGLGIVPG
ncbi:RloB family protein [Nonomuraea sp. CA-141351]|uniref:RloB family protein n=1 Tax=Nonomuraea sp. CA-141351 TaxID=3239996 RepID=UPI003D8CF0E6